MPFSFEVGVKGEDYISIEETSPACYKINFEDYTTAQEVELDHSDIITIANSPYSLGVESTEDSELSFDKTKDTVTVWKNGKQLFEIPLMAFNFIATQISDKHLTVASPTVTDLSDKDLPNLGLAKSYDFSKFVKVEFTSDLYMNQSFLPTEDGVLLQVIRLDETKMVVEIANPLELSRHHTEWIETVTAEDY